MHATSVTLRRDAPIPYETGSPDPKIMKRQILSMPKIRSVRDSSPEILAIKHRLREYKRKVEEQAQVDEIADFENRVFGKTKRPKPLELTPPSREEVELLESVSPASPIEFYNMYKRHESCPVSPRAEQIKSALATLPFSQRTSPSPVRARAQSSLTNEVPPPPRPPVHPAVWTILDEPTMLTGDVRDPMPPRKTTSPWYRKGFMGDNSKGIPLVADDLREDHERKIARYMATVTQQRTRDMQTRDEKLREKATERMTATRKKREEVAQMCTATGQDWVARKIAEMNLKKMNQVKEKPISADELDAMARLTKRDEQMRQEAIAKKKQAEAENQP